MDRLNSTVLIAESSLPVPPKKSIAGNCEQYRHIVEQYDWEVEIAMAICSAESNGNETAVNWNDQHRGCTGSSGLFQIACIHRPIAEMQDPLKNIQQAYKIYSERNSWRPWGAWSNGSYLKYLK